MTELYKVSKEIKWRWRTWIENGEYIEADDYNVREVHGMAWTMGVRFENDLPLDSERVTERSFFRFGTHSFCLPSHWAWV